MDSTGKTWQRNRRENERDLESELEFSWVEKFSGEQEEVLKIYFQCFSGKGRESKGR